VSDEPRQPASDHDDSVARGAELREELAITDARRAEEEEAKAQEAVEAAEEEESKKAAKRRQAEERAKGAAAAAAAAREQAAESDDQPTRPLSGATMTGPGVGSETEPKVAAVAASGSRAAPQATGARSSADVEGPEKPELYIGAAFVGAFLFARILKKIAE
jgi:hypothetical protein